MNLPIDLIEPGTRLREVHQPKVDELISSIRDVGLLNPITLYPKKVLRGGNWVEGYGLIAGAHRLEAYRQIGHTDIPATVAELDDLHRQIAECDENLRGPNLTPPERAMFTKRRKEAYEALHPETRNGVNQHSSLRQVGEPSTARFTTDTAKASGQSERAVQRDAERGQKILPEVLEMINGTALGTGAYLDKLKSMTGSEQFKAAKRDLSNLGRRSKKTDPKVVDRERVTKKANQLFTLWMKADEPVRALFKKKAGLVGMVHPAKSIDPPSRSAPQ